MNTPRKLRIEEATRPSVLLIGDCKRSESDGQRLFRHVEKLLIEGGAKTNILLPEMPSRCPSKDVAASDAVMVVARERNRSYSGSIKMLLDSLDPDSVAGKPFGLMSYSDTEPAATAVAHLRVVVAALNGIPIPAEVCTSLNSLNSSGKDRAGKVDADLTKEICGLITQLLGYSRRMAAGRRPNRAQPKLVPSPRTGFDLAQPVDGTIYKGIAMAVAYIKENFADQTLSLDTVANAVFMSRYHFSRKFRQETGRRFIDYLIMLRMTEARKLLIETNLTVTAIAAAVGYRDLSNFERTFKKLFGTQPSQYRSRYAAAVVQKPTDLTKIRRVPPPRTA